MSSISANIPTLLINSNDLENLLVFIFNQENLLKQFGAIKIQLNSDCKLSLKKRRKNLTLRPMMAKIIQTNSNQYLYQVKKVNHSLKSLDKSVTINDENQFWSSLSNCEDKNDQSLNISYATNVTFFTRRKSRSYFDLNQIPNESLLKLTKRKVKQNYVPCMKRAHSSGGIFPLTCVKQRLFQLDYHHQGGNHHWYIIPHCQREYFEKILNELNCCDCLDHGQIFINPSLLDQYHIRYSHCIQQPNEFIVLSAGSLFQSWTEDPSWSESIVFALPSWILDGHASYPDPICQCHSILFNSYHRIDHNLFKTELIHKYIQTYLNLPQTSIQLENVSQQTTSFQDFTLDEHLSQIDIENNQIFMNIMSNCTNDYDLFSIDDSLDMFTFNLHETQLEHRRNTNHISSNVNMNIDNDQQTRNNEMMINRKVLFVSGLRNDIDKTILRNYFHRCRKIILKQHRTKTLNVKYAFIIHRTCRDARQNFERSIDYQILGNQCQIQYSNYHFNHSNINLFIKQIPENVTQFDLNQLFPNCQILTYHPAQLICQPLIKIQKGYAIIHFNTQDQAFHVLKHSHLYKINNQLLHISIYKGNKYSSFD